MAEDEDDDMYNVMASRKDDIDHLIKNYGMQRILEDLVELTTEMDVEVQKTMHDSTYLQTLIDDLQTTYKNYMARYDEEGE